jgi:hypothetical protein
LTIRGPNKAKATATGAPARDNKEPGGLTGEAVSS